MARALFLLLILYCITFELYGQPGRQFAGPVESNLIRESGGNITLYVSIRIPFHELIFEKKDSVYTSGFSFQCELFDAEKLIERKSAEEKVSVNSYESTLDESGWLQAFISFKLGNSKFMVKPYLLRFNTSESIPLNEITIDPALNNRIFRPVVAEASQNDKAFYLVNRGGVIPWDGTGYFLLIPAPDSIRNTRIKISQFQQSLIDTLASDLKIINFSFNMGGDRIILSGTELIGNNSGYLILTVPASVEEGDLQISIENGKKRTIFNIPVVWLNKPFILGNLDQSIKLLNVITDGKAAEIIRSAPNDTQYRLLKKEWDKIAGISGGGVNPLMKEFYSRADYTLKNFSWNGQMNGAESDRGKIYLRFGKPTGIERTYNNKNEITETWYYSDLDKEFIFEDTGGKGNFVLRR